MKANKYLYLSLLSFLLMGCDLNISSNKSSYSYNDKNEFTHSSLVLSEFYASNDPFNSAFEITNIGESKIDLSSYIIKVYKGAVAKSEDTFSLKGEINPKESYVICGDKASLSLKNLADEELIGYENNGYFPIGLYNKDDSLIDSIGRVGFMYNFAYQISLVRKKEYFVSQTIFQPYEWVRFSNKNLTHLGNSDMISEETLLEGPKLTSADFEKPFIDNQTHGNGGLLEVSLIRNVDGDTSYFNFGSRYASFGVGGTESTRYYGINTPEIDHGDKKADPYGYEAKANTSQWLSKAKKILVQSISGVTIREVYGRMLLNVWISLVDNPSPSDYILLNYVIVKEGYSNPAFVEDVKSKYDMCYNDISFIDYLYDAKEYAIKLNLKIHSIGQ